MRKHKKEVKMKRKIGRPMIEIDFELVKKLCAIFCTSAEISNILGISVDTLERRIKKEYKMGWKEFFEKYSAEGKKSLRAKQFEMAMKGNVTMLIWLGKQYLNQKETITNINYDNLPEFENMSNEELLSLINRLKQDEKE